MNILHIMPYSPVPPIFGGATRMYHLLSHYTRGHSVSVITHGDETTFAQLRDRFGGRLSSIHLVQQPWTYHWRRMGQLYAHCTRHSHFYSLVHNRAIQNVIDWYLARNACDVIQSEFSPMGLYDLPGDVVKVLDAHNVEFDNFRRIAGNGHTAIRRYHYRREAEKSYREEVEACRRHDSVMVTSSRDASLLEQAAPGTRTMVVPNGVDTSYFTPSGESADPASIVFTGMMAYVPNYDGMIYFLDRVFPFVLAQYPTARITIVGNRPPALLLKRQSANVTITGFVPDVRPYMRRASVYVVPLRMGGGTRLKVLEAMAMKLPIVSTSIGCEGIDVRHGSDIFIEDDPRAFAGRVVELLRTADLRRRLGERGYELVRANYDWRTIGMEAERCLRSVVAAGPGPLRVHREKPAMTRPDFALPVESGREAT